MGPDRNPVGLRVGPMRPVGQGGGQEDQETAAANRTGRCTETIRLESAMGIVEEEVEVSAEESAGRRQRQGALGELPLREPGRGQPRECVNGPVSARRGPARVAAEQKGCPMSGCLSLAPQGTDERLQYRLVAGIARRSGAPRGLVRASREIVDRLPQSPSGPVTGTKRTGRRSRRRRLPSSPLSKTASC